MNSRSSSSINQEDKMHFSELCRFAAVPVRLNVRRGDRVLLLADTRAAPRVLEALAVTVQQHGGEPTLVIVPALDRHGDEPARPAAGAVLGSDLVIGCCSVPITHTDAIRNGLQQGIRYVAMGSTTEENLTNGAATADYERIDALTMQLTEILRGAEEVHITTPVGTDLKMRIGGRQAICFSGKIRNTQLITAFPDGEATISPVEGSANGTIVIDTSFHEIGHLREPIILQVEEGHVQSVSGGIEADMLRTIWAEKGDANSGNIAEMAIGTNERARLIGNTQEHKKLFGSVHVGFGDNLTLGGSIRSLTHMDGVIRSPHITIDGRLIVKDNRFSPVVSSSHSTETSA
jgi:leucyl aminopeptidase (aminopeptidase T)